MPEELNILKNNLEPQAASCGKVCQVECQVAKNGACTAFVSCVRKKNTVDTFGVARSRRRGPCSSGPGAPGGVPPMKEWKSHSRFPCSAQVYYDLMLDGKFQQTLHMTAMKMGCYDVTDDVQADGSIKRVVFSEPRLNLPAVLARVMKKAQAYHENAVFNHPFLERRVKVVPCMAGEMLDFSFHEWVRPDSDGDGGGGGTGCVVESVIKLHVKGGWIARLLERFIKSQCKVKIAERDKHMNDWFRERGLVALDGFGTDDGNGKEEKSQAKKGPETQTASSVVVSFENGNTHKPASRFSAPASLSRELSLASLSSHPLPPVPRKSALRRARASWSQLSQTLSRF